MECHDLGYYTSCSVTFGLSSNFCATYGLEHFFGNLWSFEHFFGNFFQSAKIYPFLVTKISFLCISSLTKRINIHVNSIVETQRWVRHARTLPSWSAVVRKLLLVQPSSASGERVFSLMNHFFTHLQENALEETVEASVMLRYSNNKRKKIQ